MTTAIHRLGTIDWDIVEANPVVFQGELYLFEGIRWAGFSHPYHDNREGRCYCRLLRMRDWKLSEPFGWGLHMPNAFVYNNRMYVTGVDDDPTRRPYLYMIESGDLAHWSEPRRIFGGESWRIHNSTLCRTEDGRFVLGMECDHPAGLFAMFFAESTDLKTFRQLPEALHGPGYTGGPILRQFGRYYYLFYISGGYETEFVLNCARSVDLRNWEASPGNPFMRPGAEDRERYPGIIFPKAVQERIRTARNINVSDMDFCNWNGGLFINYSWGDQKGTEFLALAKADAGDREFCESYFD